MTADVSQFPSDRYECLIEPFDTWMIWDNLKDEPAMLDGALLMSLDEGEAGSICSLLNRENRRGRQDEDGEEAPDYPELDSDVALKARALARRA